MAAVLQLKLYTITAIATLPIDTIDLVEFAVEFADAEVGGGHAGMAMLENPADYGCVHTHCLLPAHSRYYGETPTVFATVAS